MTQDFRAFLDNIIAEFRFFWRDTLSTDKTEVNEIIPGNGKTEVK